MNSRDKIFCRKFCQTVEFRRKGATDTVPASVLFLIQYGYGPHKLAERHGCPFPCEKLELFNLIIRSDEIKRFTQRPELLFCDFNSDQNRENQFNKCTQVNKVSSQSTSVTHHQLQLSSPTLISLDRPSCYPPPNNIYKEKS